MNFRKIENDINNEWIVLLHGLGGESQLFYKQIDEFSKKYNLFLIDLPGHGTSEGIEGKYYDAEEVVEKISELLYKEEIPKAHFVTFSLGTIIGNEFLCSKPELIKSIVLIGPVLKFALWSKFLIEFAWVFRKLVPYMTFYKIFAYIIMPKKSHKKSRFYFVREAAKLGRKEFVKWVYLLKNSKLPYKKTAKVFSDIKKLYLIGAEDHLFIKEAKEANKKDKNASLVVVEGCGHVCIIEKPKECNEAIFNFIK